MCLMALLTGCASSNTIPIDDAYHWEELKTKPAAKPAAPAEEQTKEEKQTPESPYTYTNVQDTTVTLVVKRKK